MGGGTVLRVRRAYLLVLALGLLAGCGGPSSQRLTRDQYASKADAICGKYKRKTDALSRPKTLSDLATVSDQLLPLLHGARRELRALRPPADEEATANAWLDEFAVTIDDVERIRDKAKAGDTAGVAAVARPALQHDRRGNELAAQLGMTVCSRG
jgi:hypothetical protein